jgi:hypothetical protein
VGLQLPRGTFAWVVAVVVALGALALVAAVFNLGPFSEPQLGRGEAIARGDEICRKAHQAFADLQRHPPGTASEASQLTHRLADIAAGELDQIRALNGPPDFEAQIDRYLAARERGIEALRAGEKAASEHDSKAYAKAQSDLADSQRARRRLARKIGFAECSRPLKGS